MKLKLSAENKNEVEQMVLILNIGLLTALKEDLISIDEAEKHLFSPYSMEKLNHLGVDQRIIDIIHEACELENIERIIPDAMEETLDKLKDLSSKLLKVLPKSTAASKKWIDS